MALQIDRVLQLASWEMHPDLQPMGLSAHVKIVCALVCHYHIVCYQPARHKRTLFFGHNLIKKSPLSISQHLRANFVNNIA
jgi:hypothetical protein